MLMHLKKNKGLSFLEILLTIAILSTGLVVIYKAFFLSLDYMVHLKARLYGNYLIENKITRMQQYYKATGEIPFDLEAGEEKVTINNKTINFEVSTNLRNVEDIKHVIEVNIGLKWLEGSRYIQLARTAYLSRY